VAENPLNLKIFNDLWTAHRPDRTGQADFWNRRADSYAAHGADEEGDEHRRRIIDTLAAKAGLGPESLVLDIGCGPGQLSLLFSGLAAGVEAFDLAPRMIELARLGAAKAGRVNVNFQVLDWAEADLRLLGWEKKFQLVLASKTPAVNDRAALEKMMSASRGACCLITQVDVRHSVIDELKPLANWDEEAARIRRSFYCVFNLLWLMGFYPEVLYFDRAWESDISLEEAGPMYTRQLEIFVRLTPKQKTALAGKLKDLSQGDRVREKVEAKVVMIFWKV
jgi:SAM-dependent methyltransferase